MDVLYVYGFKSVGSYKHKLSRIESLVILYWGINCTVTIDFHTTGSVPSGPILSVLPMVCLYQLKNCCLKM